MEKGSKERKDRRLSHKRTESGKDILFPDKNQPESKKYRGVFPLFRNKEM